MKNKINNTKIRQFIDLFTLPRSIIVAVTVYVVIGYFTGEKVPEWNEMRGNMNGVQFAMPKEHMSSRVEYDGESWLDPANIKKKPHERTYEDNARHIGIKFDHKGEQIIFTVTDANLRDRPEFKYKSIDGFRLSMINELSPESLEKQPKSAYKDHHPKSPSVKKVPTTDIWYEFRTSEEDQVWGLKWAESMGHSTDYLQFWNENIYWAPTDVHEDDIDLIICRKGTAPGVERSRRQCQHYFYNDEWDARIKVFYYYQNLKDWKEIKATALEMLNSIKITNQ